MVKKMQAKFKGLNEDELNKRLREVVAARDSIPTKGSRTDPEIIKRKKELKDEFDAIQEALMELPL